MAENDSIKLEPITNETALRPSGEVTDVNLASSTNAPPSQDNDVEDEDLPDRPFDAINSSRFNEFAWWILQVARRVKLEGPHVKGISARRLAAAMLALGYKFSNHVSSNTWLMQQSSLPRNIIWRKLKDTYPQIGTKGFFSSNENLPELRLTPTLSKVLGNADEVAKSAQAEKIAARHLLAAVLAHASADNNNNVASFLRGFRIEPATALQSLIEDLPNWAIDDNIDAFRPLLTGSSGHTIRDPSGPEVTNNGYARLDPDSPEGIDKLDITNDVNALAKMLAAWRLQPPLAVGLFGEWGSGKTFFMTKLRKAVAELSEASRQRKHTLQKNEAYCKYIAQVEFNAWHFSEGDLWAAMVSHIFANLRLTEGDSATEVAKRTKAAMDVLKAREADAQQKVKSLRDSEREVVEKERAKADAEKNAREAEAELSITRHDLVKVLKDDPQLQKHAKDLLNQAGLDANALHTAEEVNKALQNARRDVGKATQFAKQLGRDLRQRPLSTLLVYVAIFGLPFVITWLLNWIIPQANWANHVVKQLLTIAPTVIALAGYISRTSQRLAEVLDEPRRQIRQEWDERVRFLATQVQDALSKREQARQAADEAANRVSDARIELESLTPQRLLAGFLAERAGSKDYRDKLGLLALVRSDFERLSNLMMAQRKNDENAAEVVPPKEDGLCLNRIILYIDDLDRCPPDRVVKVLQAIHLLLAFPLFVVVVGVDARWVQRSLRTQYRLLLAGDFGLDASGAAATPAEPPGSNSHHVDGLDGQETIATPRDYLEKIFQIPLWLRTLSDDLKRDLVESLIQEDTAKVAPISPAPILNPTNPPTTTKITGPIDLVASLVQNDTAKVAPILPNSISNSTGAATTNTSTVRGPIESNGAAEVTPAAVASTTMANGSSTRPTSVQEPSGANNHPVQIDHLRLNDKEIDVMKQLSRLYGRSPRAIKRYVNCYRLFKSMQTERLVKAAKSNERPWRSDEAALFLLAIVVGAPMTARRLVDSVADLRNAKRSLVEVLRSLSSVDAAPQLALERKAFESFYSLLPSDCNVETARDLVFRMWRFSFRSAEPGEEITEPEADDRKKRKPPPRSKKLNPLRRSA